MAQGKFSFKELAKVIEEVPRRHHQKLICIDGVGGVGKSTFAEKLQQVIPQSSVVHIDDFYKPVFLRVADATSDINPNFDWARFGKEVVEPVVHGERITHFVYDWHADRLTDSVRIPFDHVVIIEGGFTMQEAFFSLYDYRIWIEGFSDGERLARVLGRDGEHMRHYWGKQWMPIERRYIEKEKPAQRADLVVDGKLSDFDSGAFYCV